MRIARKIEQNILIVVVLMTLSKSFAWAGDYAERKILGFSPDGRYFAFEQYGVEDGSGFPYAEIFVVDAERDEWAAGFPIRKRIDNEKATLTQVRKALAQEANTAVAKYKISEPGEHLASNPRSELGAKQHVTINNAHRFTPPKMEPISFSLTEKTLESSKCSQYSEMPMKGFKLEMMEGRPIREAKEEHANPRGKTVTLHDDQSLPKSRGCTLGYAIADILRYQAESKVIYGVLLHIDKVGFEGPDGRFLAVTRVCQDPLCGLGQGR